MWLSIIWAHVTGGFRMVESVRTWPFHHTRIGGSVTAVAEEYTKQTLVYIMLILTPLIKVLSREMYIKMYSRFRAFDIRINTKEFKV